MNVSLPNISFRRGNVTVNVDLSRIADGINRAQYWLDSQISNDMLPYMPMDTGTMIQATRGKSAALAGTGLVVAASTPYGRYLYNGKVMVDSVTGKGPRKIETSPGEYILRFRKGATLVPTDRPLVYSNPLAQPRWFDVAKANNLQSWIDGVKREITGGV